jgi:uncharacterized protein (DUF302 family)
MVITVQSKKNIDQVCEDLQRAITSRKFGVVGVHNMKETMAKKGVSFETECRIFEVCHPGHAKTVLEQNMAISTALPCRVSVYEEAGSVVLATLKPALMLQMFGGEGLDGVAQEVERILVESMDEAAK